MHIQTDPGQTGRKNHLFQNRKILHFVLWGAVCISSWSYGDHFRVLERDGTTTETDARLVATERGVVILELRTGEYRPVPAGAIQSRTPGEDPEPMTPEELCSHLKGMFPDGLTRSLTLEKYGVVVVLGSALSSPHEARVQSILRKATKFMKSVETVYGAFCKQSGLQSIPPRLPLGMLIFESGKDFDEYVEKSTHGQGLSSSRLSGFYSGLTNLLAMRLSECLTFEVPAHEAMHQQSYNRGTFHRLAPIPHWFDEGLATGFETVGSKISGSPYRVSARYAKQALEQDSISWDEMLREDSLFSGNVLAGEAYGQAWGLHWLLVTRHKAGYARYVKILTAKTALQEDSPEIRQKDFRDSFGKTPEEFEEDFLPALRLAHQKSHKLEIEHNPGPGMLVIHDGLANVEVTAVNAPGPQSELRVKGRLRNTSPIREMAFYVTVETDAGTYADWFIPRAPMNREIVLEPRVVNKFMQGAPPRSHSSSFSVRVRSTPLAGLEAQSWEKGDLPVPGFGQ